MVRMIFLGFLLLALISALVHAQPNDGDPLHVQVFEDYLETVIASGPQLTSLHIAIILGEVNARFADVMSLAAFQPDALRTTHLIYSDYGEYYIEAKIDGDIVVRDTNTDDLVTTFNGHSTYVWEIKISDTADRVASSDDEGNVLIWDPFTGTTLTEVTSFNQRPAVSISWNRDGSQISVVFADSEVVSIFDSSSGELVDTITTPTTAFCARFHPSLDRLAVCDLASTLIFDFITDSVTDLVDSQGKPLESTRLEWNADGTGLAIATLDGQIVLWNSVDGSLNALKGTLLETRSLQWSPHEDFLLGVGRQIARVWRMSDKTIVDTLDIPPLLAVATWRTPYQVTYIDALGYRQTTQPYPTQIPATTAASTPAPTTAP
ncbi:MAG: hypothetical protein IPM16_21960 [Chloroflexi bacterium]|nr:hypothetical protein [Chloroflexota bacterium]